jgi:phosphoribosylglycinamide formyltransferase-1
MKPLVVFAYEFPHRKTHDFIMEIIANGFRDTIVLAAGAKVLPHSDSRKYFDSSLMSSPPIPTADLCKNMGIPFHLVDHDDYERIYAIVRESNSDVAIISGARIIKANIISLFPRGIINFHPGKIPETSGLDSFFYTIKNRCAPGVTTHFIDSRVDAGQEVCFDAAMVSLTSTPETILENIYQLQRVALRRLLLLLKKGNIPTRPIIRPAKNLPMTPDQKLQVMTGFSSWRAYRWLEQEHDSLVNAVTTGRLQNVISIIESAPCLLDRKTATGWSPLIIAAHNGHIEIVDYLLKRGANPNDSGLNGTTVLMYAKTKLLNTESPKYEMLEILIAAGADVLRTDSFGKTVIDYVAEKGDFRMLKYLNQRTKTKGG